MAEAASEAASGELAPEEHPARATATAMAPARSSSGIEQPMQPQPGIRAFTRAW
jgi:hypothetical protein